MYNSKCILNATWGGAVSKLTHNRYSFRTIKINSTLNFRYKNYGSLMLNFYDDS